MEFELVLRPTEDADLIELMYAKGFSEVKLERREDDGMIVLSGTTDQLIAMMELQDLKALANAGLESRGQLQAKSAENDDLRRRLANALEKNEQLARMLGRAEASLTNASNGESPERLLGRLKELQERLNAQQKDVESKDRQIAAGLRREGSLQEQVEEQQRLISNLRSSGSRFMRWIRGVQFISGTFGVEIDGSYYDLGEVQMHIMTDGDWKTVRAGDTGTITNIERDGQGAIDHIDIEP